jgi:acyl-coenzyme A synthetase/AMP-(fatty) acid ligase
VLKLPEISEAAAIGVPDAERGERLVVFVIAAHAAADSAALAARVTAQVEAQDPIMRLVLKYYST